MQAGRDLGYQDACDGRSSYTFRRIQDLATQGRDERVQFLIPIDTSNNSTEACYETPPTQVRQHPRLDPSVYPLMHWIHNHPQSVAAVKTNTQCVPEVAIGGNFPSDGVHPWRLRIGGATSSSNPVPKAILTDGGIQIERGGKAWSHNFVVALPSASQFERDHTKCFTVVNGSQEVFNVLGSGRLVTQGEIGCRRVHVHVDPNTIVWPDYVFADGYQTPSWQELETHLKEKKHLPGIPTAEEVACEGLDLAKVNAQLLEQIEILNLRVLELNRSLETLEQPSR